MQRVFAALLSTFRPRFCNARATARLQTGGLSVLLFTRCWQVCRHFTPRTVKSSTKTLSTRNPNLIMTSCQTKQETYASNCFRKTQLRDLVVRKTTLRILCYIHGSNALIGRKSQLRLLHHPTNHSSTDLTMLSIFRLNLLEFSPVRKIWSIKKVAVKLHSRISRTRSRMSSKQ